MRKTAVIAFTTFRELVRERMTLVILGLAIGMAFFSVLLGEMTLDESDRLIVDLSLWTTEGSSLFLVLILGSTVLSREIERQTCLLVLARPVGRFQFLLGKWLGSSLVVGLLVIILSLTLALIRGSGKGLALLEFCILMKALVILSWTLLASIAMRPFLSGAIGFTIYLVGHWLSDLAFFAKQSELEAAAFLVQILRWIVPSFDLYNWKSHFYLVHPPLPGDIMGMIFQTLAFVCLGLFGAGFFFRRKDIV